MGPLAYLVACAACAAADPTLPSAGAEQPYAGRVHASADLRVTSSRALGYEAREISVAERRFDFGLAYAPTSDLLLDAKLPLYQRSLVDLGDGTRAARFGVGDAELTASYLVWKSAPGKTRRRFGLVLGAKAPTAPTEDAPARGAVTAPLPASLQPGCASIVAELGAYYVVARGAWSFQSSTMILMPFAVRDAPHTGDSLRATTTVQLQPTRAFAARLGALGRVDGAGEYGESDDPSSGGALGYVSTEIVVSPAEDLVLTAGAFFPALQALRGTHREAPIGVLGAAYDF